MENVTYKELLEQSNAPALVFDFSTENLVYSNRFSAEFTWDSTSLETFFGEDYLKIKNEILEKNQLKIDLNTKNERKKRFIFEITLIKNQNLIYCFGENKTEINEHKLMIKSFTTMVEQTNKKLKEKSNELVNILNTMNQATFMVLEDMTIAAPISTFSNVIFEKEIEGQSVLSVLYDNLNLSSEDRVNLNTIFSTVFGEDELQWELNNHLFPTNSVLKLEEKSKNINISTYPIWNDQKILDRIMLVIQDVTEVNLLIRSNQEKEKKVKIIQELAEQEPGNISQYFRSSQKLLSQSKSLIEIIEKNHEVVDDLFRHMHTLKGNSRLFNLSLMSASTHDLENTIKEFKDKQDGNLVEKLEEGYENVQRELTNYSKVARDILKITDSNLSEHVVNLVSMLTEIECHLLANTDKSLNSIDSALLACSSWAIAIDDEVISASIFEINNLILDESFNYESRADEFTTKVIDLIKYLKDKYEFKNVPHLDYFANAVSFIVELSQIFQENSNRLRSPHILALYRNSSSIVLRKVYELKVLNSNVDNQVMLNTLGCVANIINKINPDFIQQIQDKSAVIGLNIDYLKNNLRPAILPLCFELEAQLIEDDCSKNSKSENTYKVSSGEILDILGYLETEQDIDKKILYNKIQYLSYESIWDRISNLKQLVDGIAFNSKKQCEFKIKGNDFRLEPYKSTLLMDSLLHVVTNAVDHGIESSSNRVLKNKNEVGLLEVTLKSENDYHIIKVVDDGAGLDRAAIIKRAAELGLVAQNDRLEDVNVYDFIFEAGFSTRKDVTETSGRGVGMGVVKKNMEAMNAKVFVQSELDKGTTFTFEIPFSS